MRRLGFFMALGTAVGCGSLLGLDDEEPQRVSVDDGGSSGSGSNEDGSRAGSSGAPSSNSSSSGSSGSPPGNDGGSSGVAGPPRFTDVVAGRQETCGVLVDGTLACTGDPPGWGRSSELMGIVYTQVDGPPLAGVQAVGVGNQFACALTRAPNRIWCWGSNAVGYLGDGTSITGEVPQVVVDDPATRTPVSDWEIAGVEPLAVGPAHTCALRAGGRVMCWGSNLHGQLGIAGQVGVAGRNYAVPVVGLSGSGVLDEVTQVAVGTESTCALRTDRQVYCWGQASLGALGDGTDGLERHVPAPVLVAPGAPLTGVTHISVGGGHGCAVTDTGHLYCWGRNVDKELGVFIAELRSLYAAQVKVSPTGAALDHIVLVSAGAGHTCAVEDDGQLWCWGSNNYGQLGNGSALRDSFANPSRVQTSTSPPTNLGDIASVSSGQYHTVARDRSGTLFTWGDRALGRDQDATTVALPVVELRR